MNDESLLKDLELLQELSDQEVEAVKGGMILSSKLPPLGDACLACLSGIDPVVDSYSAVISEQ